MSALIISVTQWCTDMLWCNSLSLRVSLCKLRWCVLFFFLLYTYTCVLVEFLKQCLISPSAERENHERPPEPDGGFQSVFSSARRAIAEPNHFHDSLSAGRDSWPKLVILYCCPWGWTGAFVGHHRQDCAGGVYVKGFKFVSISCFLYSYVVFSSGCL